MSSILQPDFIVIQNFLNRLLTYRLNDFEVSHHAEIPARPPIFENLSTPLAAPVAQAMLRLGITALYSHQAAAITHIRSGKHTVVSTPTSSGKSLIYNLCMAEALLKDPDSRALYLFPVKALARDQLDSLEQFFSALAQSEGISRFSSCVYDGDTTSYQRASIRRCHPNVLLTNPDMLHYGLLAFHPKWEQFWRRLRYVVVDEMHTYRGVFGSHVAQIFRRLRRICRHYGSDPRFILLSATIANPGELAASLTGVSPGEIATVSDQSGAPGAKRHFVFLRPAKQSVGHPAATAARLIVQAAHGGLKTIAFTQSRRLTELVHMSVIERDRGLRNKISSYRAGFLPEERRVIEQKLAAGALSAVVSTSALELGIDIGGLDLCILVGYPGTVMNTWQRGGRVGRSGRESAIVLIPDQDALDQYIVNHPARFLESSYEIAVIDPMNPEILKAHLPCAAEELPISASEDNFTAAPVLKALEKLVSEGRLIQTLEGSQWISATPRPHRLLDIRSAGPSYAIIKTDGDKTTALGKNEGVRALKECHPGAIYLHRGQSYVIESLDLEKKLIRAAPAGAAYFTRALSQKETEILERVASKPAGNFITGMGRLRVTENISGFESRRLHTQELLSKNALDLPPQTFETVGFWIEIEPVLAATIKNSGLDFMGGIHAIEHALISMFPLFAVCDRNDIGGISIPMHHQIQKGAVFVYDGYPGGIGLSARGYDIIEQLIERTKELIVSCPCSQGCPACIHSPKCGSGNKPLDKTAAIELLRYLSGEKSLGNCTAASPKTPLEQRGQLQAQKSAKQYRIGFLDLETQKLASEVGGWHNTHLMRVSVAVLYEEPSGVYKVYREQQIAELLEQLRRLDLIVGFNISRFDYRVLGAYTTFDLDKLPTFDILDEIYKGLNFRLSLEHLAQATLGRAKGGDGVQAVDWFRQGNLEDLERYCREDVAITRDLFYHGLDRGYLVYTNKAGTMLRFPTPWKIDELVRTGK
jgi:DEAD/DEAH box helicase domain-containing protein